MLPQEARRAYPASAIGTIGQMTLERYAYNMGSVVANFQSLEFALRAALQNLPTARPIGLAHGENVYNLPVAHELPVSELTSYNSLGELIDKYNQEARKRNGALIDRSLVEIRDALAHGRISAEITSDDLRLIKFSKPEQGRVKITFNVLLSDWFSEQRSRTRMALKEVHENQLTQ